MKPVPKSNKPTATRVYCSRRQLDEKSQDRLGKHYLLTDLRILKQSQGIYITLRLTREGK